MANLQGGPINTGEYTRSMPEGTPLPVGIYKGIPVRTAQKETHGKKGAGVMVEVEFDITWPEEYSNRKFWDRFNIMNPSPDTVRIAKEALADLGAAAGYPILEDDEQLLGREVLMELAIEPAKPYTDSQGVQRESKAQNRCRKYWPANTDVEAAKKAVKEQKAAKGVSAPNQAAQGGNITKKWGQQANPSVAATSTQASPASTVGSPVSGTSVQPSASTSPATSRAPWKRNNQ